MKVFRSQLEELLPAKELCFESTPGFGAYRKFLESAISHPAKMNTKLLEFLIRTFTREGETVLDPMCGSGSMGVVASLLNRNAVQVDIEKKFIGWAEEAKWKVKAKNTLTPKGTIRNVCGDARKLSSLLENVDVVVTSPPYSESLNESKNTTSNLKREKRLKTRGHQPKNFMGGKARNCQLEDGLRYSHNPKNIGNLPHGNVDVVITSPPYADLSVISYDNVEWTRYFRQQLTEKGYIEWQGKRYTEQEWRALNRGCIDGRTAKGMKKGEEHYSQDTQNIGNLPVDAVITSPPYEETKAFHDVNFMKEIAKDQSEKHKKHEIEGHGYTPEARINEFSRMAEGHLDDVNNIGNLKRETYLEAMLKVYMEMYKVLKPEGLAIIVIKPFIRNKQVVDLPLHTWLLLQKVGFALKALFKLRLEQESFWRVLYRKKYPDVEVIRHEYILVTKK